MGGKGLHGITGGTSVGEGKKGARVAQKSEKEKERGTLRRRGGAIGGGPPHKKSEAQFSGKVGKGRKGTKGVKSRRLVEEMVGRRGARSTKDF